MKEGSEMNEMTRDQIRRYRIIISIVGEGGKIIKEFSGGIFDNYQIGEMNQTREMARHKLLNSGYSDTEAEGYLNSIPSKEITKQEFIDERDFDLNGMVLINNQIDQMRERIGVKSDGSWM